MTLCMVGTVLVGISGPAVIAIASAIMPNLGASAVKVCDQL